MQKTNSPLLYQVNTRVWLTQIAQNLGRPATFDDIPDEELNQIAGLGFDWVYFLGVWQTGEAGRTLSRSNPEWLAEYRKVLPDVTQDDICGSPFAVAGYSAHTDFGGDPALQRLHHRLNQRGMRLMLDFVPNHTAPDHPWVFAHPEYYVHGVEIDLKNEPHNYTRLASCHGPQILARGRDPYFPGWADTVQLNFGSAGLQKALQAELLRIAGLCDGLRCDMAMLILPEIFERTWGITSAPFWPVAIPAVRARFPDFTFMAEVYWDLENILLEQGVDYAYDKRLYDRLHEQDATLVREHLLTSFPYLHHLAHFLENHDEGRAAAEFPPLVHQAAAVTTFLTPGLRFFHQGQLTGSRKKISVHLCRGPQETPDGELSKFYSRLLELLREPVVRTAMAAGQWLLLESRPAWESNPTHADFIAGAWQAPEEKFLLHVVNYAAHQSQCYLPLPYPQLGGEIVRLVDHMGPYTYERHGDSLITTGLYLDLPPWGFHVFELTIL